MATTPRSDTGEARRRPDAQVRAGTPRWVKVFGIAALVVVVLVVLMLTRGGGGHGPGRHTSSGGVTAPTALAVDTRGANAAGTLGAGRGGS